MSKEEMKLFPLTQAQRRILYMELLYPNTTVSTIAGSLILQGSVDPNALQKAIHRVIEENDIFRLKFITRDGEPRQWFDENKERIKREFEYIKYQSISEAEAALKQFAEEPISHLDPQLYQFNIFNINETEHWVNLKFNHMICDGVAAHHVCNFITQHYIELINGEESPLQEKSSYKDYIYAEQEYESSERYQKDKNYWVEKFSTIPEVINIKPYPPYTVSADAKRMNMTIGSERYHQLNTFCQQHKISLYTLFLTSLYVYIHKVTRTLDIPVGTVFANRTSRQEKECLGMFVSTVATRLLIDPDQDLLTFIHNVSKEQKNILRHQKYPYNKLIDDLREIDPKSDTQQLFSISIDYQPIRWTNYDDLLVQHRSYFCGHEVDDIVFRIEDLIDDQEIVLSLVYRVELFEEEEMSRMMDQLQIIVDQIMNNPQQNVRELSILDDREKDQILNQFNGRKMELPLEKTIQQMFEEQVERTPDAIAVVYQNQELTYSELNQRANQLARTIRTKGIEPDQLVGIMTHRSLEMIVGILGILKAGAAYVPIDPEYPEERIRYLLKDSGAKILLLQQELIERVEFNGFHVLLDDEDSYADDGSNLEPITTVQHLAYVIYTSGTTGRPKGVLIEHAQVVSMASAWKEDYHLHEPGICWLQWASFSFDVFTGDYVRALLHGGKLVICPSQTRLDFVRMTEMIQQHQIEIFESTPAFVIPLMDYIYENQIDICSLKTLILGSDQCSTEAFNSLIQRFGSQMRILNSYGVTEACIDSCYFESDTILSTRILPIGKPLPNVRMYILDEDRFVQPIGVAGELFIGGKGVGRGYLNRPELSAEKFVENPFISSERMYRTGDSARWLPDGNLEFLGRIDDQVKVRGYRIELGEIESQLAKLELIKEGVVVAREDETGQKQLCAYYVADHVLDINEIKLSLSQELPSYMVPSYFIQLEKLPLTPNGKIDRKSLPKPDGKMTVEIEYVAPRTEVEQILASIWQGVLGVGKVGRMDHFFELGGDSIKSIQISSRLYQVGYKLEMKDLFKYPTIASLSPYVQAIGRTIDQGEVTGVAKLTPIQHWFFEQEWEENHHYNQAMMLYRREGFEIATLQQVLEKIAEHHDALRMVFPQTERGYEAWNRGIQGENLYELEVLDFREETECAEAIEAKATQIQSSINLSEGPLLKLGLFQCQDGDHLLIAIHHLVVDAVSWRILIEDLSTGYEQAMKGEDIRLPKKTDSFLTWAEQLSSYAEGQALAQEVAYWQKITQIETQPLPKDHLQQRVLAGASESITVLWNREETEQLLKQVPRAYNTEVNDILLTALGLALHSWSGLSQVKINLEGHGREEILPELDITRTVGWFTSEYPVLLETEEGKDLGYQIKSVKEALRQIPNKGIGYGIWRYLSHHDEGMEWGLEPEISFNYLGQFDQDIQEEGMSPYSIGASNSDKHVRTYALDLNGMVSEGELKLDISYSPLEYQRETIEKLAQCLKESLQEIINHCITKEKTELTPSDVLLKGLTIEEVEQIAEQTQPVGEIENIYRLTPMQKGILFHSEMDPHSGAYFDQLMFVMRGHLVVEQLKQSLSALMQRHAVLRTGFYSGWREEPLQIVYKSKDADFYYKDLSEYSDGEATTYTKRFIEEDKKKGFNLEQDALVRLSILRVKENEYNFILSSHHILIDGWCMPILIKELFEIYFAFQNQQVPNLDTIPSYSAYIEWLEKQDNQGAASYWKAYLENYEQQTMLPQQKNQVTKGEYQSAKMNTGLDKALTGRINQIAQQNKVTMNTLIQVAWGILLQKYNNTDDVVFGSVVSGRPAEVPGIEKMIGLFINTVPVRIGAKGNETIVDLMNRVQIQYAASQEYDFYPLFEIQAQTEQKQGLINHIMIFENYPIEEEMGQLNSLVVGDFEITNINIVEQSNYDLNLVVIPGEAVEIQFEYNALVYGDTHIANLQGHFVHLLEQIANNPSALIKELELSTASEKERQMKLFNNTELEYRDDMTIQQLFEEQVNKTPDAIAVVYENQELTYSKLNQRANQLAHTLRAKGVQPEQPVGIIAHRSVEMVVGILAILKAGGAYIPIDPEYPEERIHYILKNSNAEVLLLQQNVLDQLDFSGSKVFLDKEESYADLKENLESIAQPQHLAYVIYTSGTTGTPKGVMIEHQQVVAMASAWNKEYGLDQESISWLQWASFAFDVFTGDFVRALLHGGKLVICPSQSRLDFGQIHGLIQQHQIQMFESTPAFVIPLMEYIYENKLEVSSLRTLILGSDQCTPEAFQQLIERYGSQMRILNSYGVTEACIDSSYFETDDALAFTGLPIGKPLPNVQMYVLNENLSIQPVGIVGELFIAGKGVGRGYFNRPELNAEKFVENPFRPEEKMYRTGDLARWLPDGNIEFLGRIDDQVKVRGFRIELGEIESKLLTLDVIKEGAVIAREEESGQKQLYAYVVAEQAVNVGEIRSALSQMLPGYMIPSYFVQVEKMPLTPNGKIDRRALPYIEGEIQTGTEYVAPRTEAEKKLVEIWQEILGVQKISIKENFFDLGGHSLRATTLVSRLHKEMSVEVSLRSIFQFPTVEKLAEVITQLDQTEHTSIPVAEAREFYPLSSAQKRLYILHQLEGAELSYNMSGEVLIEGPLDRERVEKAFREMIHRHESLRTGFEMIEGEPVQKIYPEIPFHLELYKSDDEGAQEIIRSFVRIFDLEKAPLLRVGLTEITSERHILMLDMHHIISDGISIAVIIDEFVQLYEGKDLLPLRIQYKDYAVWQRKEFDSERLKKQEAYWVDTLAGESPVLELPTDYTRPAVKNFAGATFYFDLDPRIEEGLRQIASQTESTLYMVLLAAYKTLLHKYSRQEDIIVGTPIAGRTHADLEPLIGMFVNTLAIRSYPSEEKTFLEFLAELKETTLLAYENQEYPFEELVELVDVTRDLSRNALFDTMFVLQNTEQGTLEIEGLHLQEYPQEYTMAKFDLTLTIDELESGLTCQMEYATSLYREETIERMSRHFVQLLESIVENPQHTLASLELILPEEREQILRVFNNSEADYPREKTIQQLFEEQAARAPERIAVIHENQVITYGELNERANRLARTLRAEGVQADHLVAIMVERSVDMLVGIIAILKAGGAYVPLDPEYPEDRLYYMLEDSGAQVLLTQRHLEDRLSYSGTKLVLDDDASYHEDGSNLASVNQPQNLAYVIYTSGTTGKPKGTLIEHKNVVRLLFNDHNLFDFNENDVWTLFHSYCFDFSVWEMYGALLYGGKVVVVPSLTAKNPKQFLQLLKDQQVTILNQTPTYFYKVLQEEAAEGGKGLALRNVIFGGEALSPYLLKDWKSKYPHIQLINMYGITETTVHVTYKEITEVEIEQAKSNIGQPIPTLSTYILDEHRNLLPVGVMGELYVAGEGVARGYLNRPDLTAEKFVDNPFKPGERMYRSGDLARWLPDGNLEYLGRIDHQVKIRGFRIELGEVESQLLKLDSMREGIVLAQKDEAGQEDLCAYFTAEREWNVSELRTALSQELPSYMIPSYFVQLEQMPLTPNGKVDRRALPKPTTGLQTGTEYVAPRTEIEEKLVQVWQEVLGVATIGVKDNFFDLGGHSLRATTLVSKIHKELNIDLALRTIFQAPTVEELAQIVSETEQNKHISIPRAMEREVYPVSSAQKRLYILHQLEGAELSYNISGQLLLEGSLDRNKVEEVFRKLIARHETLRTSFEIEHGEPVQRIHPNVSFTLEYVQSSDDEAQERIRQFVRAFDLGVAPLFRAGLIELEEKRFILMLDMHHIISDGVSIERITEEFAKLYEGHELPPLRIQYKDYAVWQQSEVQSERIQKQGEYWLDSLKGELPVLELPTDYARPAVQSFMGETYDFVIDSSLSKSLKQLTNQTGTTLHMLLLAVYKTLLHKYSGQEDIIVGTPIAGRTHSDLEPLLGMFVNTLAIRSYPSGAKGFIDFLSEVKETTLLAYENQEYPFEELVEHVNVSRDLSRNAIFDTMFVLESTAQNDLNLKDIKMQDYPYGDQMAKFDLSLTIEESAEGLQCNMEYATSLYSERTIKRMADHFVKLIEAIITNPQNNLSSLEIMLSQEREEILYVFNEREAVFSHEKTIQQLFEEQVNRTPDSIAVVYENQELTYSKLNQRANQLAHTLRAKGVQPEQPVGIIAHRSVEMVVGILAILKAGGAYIPIDPEYPEERIHYILKNSNAEVLLLQQNVLDQLDFAGSKVFLDKEESYADLKENLESIAQPQHLAYVIYTSGTTGTPKGVMIEHQQVVAMASAWNKEYGLDQESISWLQWASFAFDVFTGDFVRALLHGGKLVICPSQSRLDFGQIHGLIQQHQIQMFESTPAFVIPLMEYIYENKLEVSSLRTLILGSDQCTPEAFQQLIERYGSQMRILNSYGVTEACIDSSYFETDDALAFTGLPIGKPLPNVQMYVLNENLSIQPVGIVGELFIAGKGVGRGYFNRPELNAEKFVENPFRPEEKMYRTGDLARWLPDGNIEFLGRIDDQVKVRGFRIELGEIESKLLTLDVIKEGAVIAREEESGQKQLYAYVVAEQAVNVGEIRSALSQMLPGYMIPSYFVQVEKMPLTPNGKIDRRALPYIEGEIQTGTEYVAPRTEAEKKLVEIWQEILGVQKISIKENFFDLGGHSLRATTLVSRLHKEMSVEVSLRSIFQFPTVEKLAEVITQLDQTEHISIPVAEAREFYPLSSAQKRLYILQQMEGSELSYNMPDALVLKGDLDLERLEAVFQQLIQRHETLRTSFEMIDGEVKQRIHQKVDFSLEYIEVNEELETAIDGFIRVFDLEKPPLLRVGVTTLKTGLNLLVLDMHHIISDGFSMEILSAEFEALYSGQVELTPLRIQYKDYAVWQQAEMQSERLKKQEDYWLNIFSGELPTLELPTDYERPKVQSFEGNTLEFTVDSELTASVQKLAEKYEITLYMFYLAAYSVLLAKHSAQEDIVIGVPIAGRTHSDLEPLIGMFVNTLAIRNYPFAEKSFEEFLLEVKERALEAHENQEYPFEELVEKLDLKRDLSRNPLFDTMFDLQVEEEQNIQKNASLSVLPMYNDKVAKFDLLLNMSLERDEMKAEFQYCTKLFKKNRIDRLSKDLIMILSQICQEPQIQLKNIKVNEAKKKRENIVESVEFSF